MPGDSDFEVQISADVSGLTSAFDEARGASEELRNSLGGIGEGASSAEGELGGLGEVFEGFGEQANQAVESLGKMTEGWGGLLGVIGGGAVAEVMQHIIETTQELGDRCCAQVRHLVWA